MTLRIAVDALGGDKAPSPNIKGAIEALQPGGLGGVARKQKVEIILVGRKEEIKEEISFRGAATLPIEIQNATQVVEMEDSPMAATRLKPDSSISVGVNLLKEGRADAFISAGNSGAMMTAAVMNLGRLKGVKRPAIATVFPTVKDPCIIVDVGANAECKPRHLFQFAAMGECYVKYVFKKRIPRIGLLSMGHEEGKGNALTRTAYSLLMESDMNFIGNIEGGDIIKGTADVVVCDGFVGNVVLKFGENAAKLLFEMLKSELHKGILRKAGARILKVAFDNIKKQVLYEEVGGAPLLGVNGTCIICHGSSNALAIRNAINAAAEAVEQDLNKHIEEKLG